MADEPVTDVYTRIINDYPTLGYLLNVDQAVAWLLVDAVNPEHPFDVATFEAKLMQTDWWKTTTDSQRSWEHLSATDPATAKNQLEQWKQNLNTEAVKAGIQLAPADLDWWAGQYVPQGVPSNSQTILNELARVYQQRPDLRVGQGDAGVGSIPSVKTNLTQFANSYFRDLTPADLDWWSAQIVSGQQTEDSFKSVIVNEAKQQFPSFANQIASGVPLDQLFSGTKATVANELEMDPNQMDLMHDPRWSKLLGVPDGNGAQRLLTRSEAIEFARSQKEWSGTLGARTQGSDLTSTILKTFGAVA